MRLTAVAAAVALLSLSLMLLQISGAPAQQPDAALSPAQRKAIEEMIHAYIVAHPEVLIEAQQALGARAEADRLARISRVLGEHRDDLYRQRDDLVLGDPGGDVAIVEFFDYNCPYCRRIAPDLARRLAADGHIKLILKPMPDGSPASAAVAYLAAASARQGRFAAYHAALLESKGQVTEAGALRLAERLSLDVARLKRDAALPEVKTVVDRSAQLAKSLNIEGTPFFLVDARYIAGVPDDFAEHLDRDVREVRKTGCRLC
ncbi:MAG: DsbA family protein [Hyphomicrobiaceae bacterium]|nr:DsbA family protein [Hyphomicrobiaceae bacterium]